MTSFGDSKLKGLNYKGLKSDLVFQRTQNVIDLSCHGIVCSALEAKDLLLKMILGFLVTPGIGPVGADQQRIATPASALKSGSDYLVIGRPIRDAEDPEAMVESIFTEIETVL